MKILQRIAVWSAGFLLFFVLIGFFAAPRFVKVALIKEISPFLQREVSIEAVRINPLRLSLTVKGFTVWERDNKDVLFSFQELFLNLKIVSLFRGALVAKEATLQTPYLHLVRHEDESYNIDDILAEIYEGETFFLFSLNNIRVIDGKIVFQDTPKTMRHLVEDMQINLPFISNMNYYADTFITPSFAAVINGTQYNLRGQIKPFETSHRTEFDIACKDLDIPNYLSYLPWKLKGRVTSAFLDAEAKLTFYQNRKEGPRLLLNGQFLVKNAAIDDQEKQPILRFPYVAIDLSPSNILRNDIRLTSLLIRDPEVYLQRAHQGEWNILSLWEEDKKEKNTGNKTDKKAENTLVIEAFEIAKGALYYRDDGMKKPFQFSFKDIQIKGNNFSTLPREEGHVALNFSLPARGTAEMNGSFGIEPLFAVHLDVNIRQLILPPFQTYLEQFLNVKIAKGNLSARGQLQWERAPEKEAAFRFSGDASLNKFSFLDTAQYMELLSGDSLDINAIELHYPSFALHIKDLIFKNFYSRLVVSKEGMLNMRYLVKEQENIPAVQEKEGKSQKEKGQADHDITIEKVIFREGTINFLDQSVQPNFSAKLIEVDGHISGLSSMDSTQGKVTIKGKWDRHAPLDITGQINPLGKEFFMDLKANVREMDLPSVTPYAGKYLGYEIEKGKLSFAVQYRVDKRKLNSTNQIFLDQLTFGGKVASPEATTLPVSLAVSLLKDRRGQIKLDIPVYGTLDDPEFSVWKIIWKVMENLLIKAAASPFSLLGAVFGAGEELSYIEFDYGEDIPHDEMIKKISILSKALAEHREMKLDIEGYVDADNDREALKRKLLEREIKVLKFNSMGRRGKNITKPDDVTLENGEYETYLRKIYGEKSFPKPRNIIGVEKSLPVAEMEKLIYANTEIKDDDLRLLAAQRAVNTKEALLLLGEVEAERVFIVSANYASPSLKEGLKKSRVDFRLK